MKYRSVIKVSLLIVTIGLVFCGSCSVLLNRASEKRKIAIDRKVPNVPFPVVIVTPDDADVQYDQANYLTDYIGKHPDYSYFIQQDQLDRVSRQITAKYEESSSNARPTLRVKQLGPGRQEVHLIIFGSAHSDESWYETHEHEKEYFPRAYRVEGAIQGLFEFLWILPISGLITALVFFLGRSAIKFISEMRRAA